MQLLRDAEILLVRMLRDEPVVAGLRSLMRQRGIGVGVVSGLGAVRDVELGYFDVDKREYLTRTLQGSYEVCSLNGSLSWFEGEPFAHVHAVLGDRDFRCFGGHLFEATVSATLELVVRPGRRRIDRQHDPDVGLHLMQLPESCPIRG